jgi:hypothetical protein
MGCGCIKKGAAGGGAKREVVRKLAFAQAIETGKIVVFYRCADYDFAPLGSFNPEGKTEVEYII